MFSSGSASRSARTTVRPPRPESKTPKGASCFVGALAGAVTGPPLSRPRTLGVARRDDPLENGHPHGDPGLDLIEDHALRPVRDLRVDLDAPVDGPRVHDDRVRPGARQGSRAQTEGAGV